MKKIFPYLGCGIGYRSELKSFLTKYKKNIDFIEISPESFMPSLGAGKDKIFLLKQLSEEFKVVVHGVNLSIASERIDEEYLHGVKAVCDTTSSPYYSDHLALTRVSDVLLGHLSPIFFCDKMLNRVISNIKFVQEYLERPLLIENISYHFVLNNSPYDEVNFLNTVANETQCGILLDLANLHTNSFNHNFDPFAYIDKIEKKHIVQFHIAGGEYGGSSGYLYDSHNNVVEKRTWELLDYALSKSPAGSILLEHDQDFFSDEYLILQLKLAKKMLRTSCNVLNG